MKTIVRTPLEKLRAKEEEVKMKDAQLQQLGIALSEEKLKNAQKDIMLSHLGQEVTQIKIELLELKGGNA